MKKYQGTQHHITQDLNLKHLCENLKSCIARMTSKNSFLTSTLPLLRTYSLLYVVSDVSMPLLHRLGLFTKNDNFLHGILYNDKENTCFGDLFVDLVPMSKP